MFLRLTQFMNDNRFIPSGKGCIFETSTLDAESLFSTLTSDLGKLEKLSPGITFSDISGHYDRAMV